MARVWVIRGGRDNRFVDCFLDDAVIGVGYFTIPDARSLGRQAIEALLRAEGTSAAVAWHAEMLVDFVHRMAPGDVVIMPDTPRGEVVIGEVAGGYEFHAELPSERYRHRRAMRWLGRHPHAYLPPGREDLYRQRPTLLELHDADDLVAHAERVRRGELGRPATERRGRQRAAPRSSTAAAAHERRVDERVCESCYQTLAASAFPGPGSPICRSCADE